MIKNFLRHLGVSSAAEETSAVTESENESIRKVIASLDALDPSQAHYVALFASILSRVAHADLHMSEAEARTIEQIVQKVGHLNSEQALLVTEIAKFQNKLLGGVENYLITREFREVSSQEQCVELLEAMFAVAAAEEGISAEENQVIHQASDELGFSRTDFLAMRSQFKEALTVLKDLPRH